MAITPEQVYSDYTVLNDLNHSDWTTDHIYAYLCSDYVMSLPTTAERRSIRIPLVMDIRDRIRTRELYQAVVDVNAALVQWLLDPPTDIVVNAIIATPGLITASTLDIMKFTRKQWETLCYHHQWIYEKFCPINIPAFDHYVTPIGDDEKLLEIPNFVLYNIIEGTVLWDDYIQHNIFNHKDPIKSIAKHRKFTKDDILSNTRDFGPFLNSIHTAEPMWSKRIIHNPHQPFAGDRYDAITFSVDIDTANAIYGIELTNALVAFHSQLTPTRCSYDVNTIVLGWTRFIITDVGVFIDEIQTDVKRPLKGLVDNATLNKIEYHVLVQSIKLLYNRGHREFFMPTWEQRNTLYKQAPGTNVPRDPYVYIPKRIGFSSKRVEGIHPLLDTSDIQYLDLRASHVNSNCKQ